MENSRVIARQAIINTYAKQGYDIEKSPFIQEIADGVHDEIFTVRAIEEALNMVRVK